MKTLYTANAHVTGGRDGRAQTDDGILDLPLAMPRSLGGPGGAANPEQLFAAGFAACFCSSVRYAAKGMGLDAGDVAVDAAVHLVAHDDGAFGISAVLQTVIPGLSGVDRHKVVEEAKRICAYSNAIRGNVAVEVRVE